MGRQGYEYRVIPAPRRGAKARGLKSAEDRFAAAVAEVMNEAAREGWEYLRSDTLPFDERQGLTGTATSWQVLLVFRRALGEAEPVAVPAAREPAAPVLRAPTEAPDGPMPPLRLERD